MNEKIILLFIFIPRSLAAGYLIFHCYTYETVLVYSVYDRTTIEKGSMLIIKFDRQTRRGAFESDARSDMYKALSMVDETISFSVRILLGADTLLSEIDHIGKMIDGKIIGSNVFKAHGVD